MDICLVPLFRKIKLRYKQRSGSSRCFLIKSIRFISFLFNRNFYLKFSYILHSYLYRATQSDRVRPTNKTISDHQIIFILRKVVSHFLNRCDAPVILNRQLHIIHTWNHRKERALSNLTQSMQMSFCVSCVLCAGNMYVYASRICYEIHLIHAYREPCATATGHHLRWETKTWFFFLLVCVISLTRRRLHQNHFIYFSFHFESRKPYHFQYPELMFCVELDRFADCWHPLCCSIQIHITNINV